MLHLCRLFMSGCSVLGKSSIMMQTCACSSHQHFSCFYYIFQTVPFAWCLSRIDGPGVVRLFELYVCCGGHQNFCTMWPAAICFHVVLCSAVHVGLCNHGQYNVVISSASNVYVLCMLQGSPCGLCHHPSSLENALVTVYVVGFMSLSYPLGFPFLPHIA